LTALRRAVTRASGRARPPGQLGGGVGVHERLDDRVQVTVQHLHEVVGLVAAAVVGHPVVREVVGPDLLAAVDGADLRPAHGAVLGGLLLERQRQQPGAQDAHAGLPVLQLALLVLHRDGHPVGRWVIRTAESVVLTLCPPGRTSGRRRCAGRSGRS
jgi:hypothetical protein